MFREAFIEDKKKKRPKRTAEPRRFPWWMPVLWVVFFGTLSYTLLFSEFDRLSVMTVSGLRDIPEGRLTGFVRDELAKKTFPFFPRDNYFLLSQDGLSEDILRRFPKISSVRIAKRFPNGIDVTVSERNRIFLFCSGDCFLPDRDGKATDAAFAYLPENDSFILRVEDESGRRIGVGDKLFDGNLPDTALRIEEGIEKDDGIPLRTTATTPARVSNELRFTTESGWDIMVSTDKDPERTIRTLRLVLEKEIPEEKRSNLRYIDLRTDGRAFYAYQGSEPTQDGVPTDIQPQAASDQVAVPVPDKRSEGSKKK